MIGRPIHGTPRAPARAAATGLPRPHPLDQCERMQLPRELRIAGYLAFGLLAARIMILALDAIAETVERRALYR